MQIVVQDSGKSISVDEAIFDYAYNEGLVHQAVVAFMNHARSGNSAQKTRAEVRGGGKKPWKQKGTGRARAGTIRSPLWRGGGNIFAAKKRDYTQKINKKMYTRAIRSIFSELNRRGDLIVLSELVVKTSKTKDFIKVMEKCGVDDALLILKDITEEVYLGSRNLHTFGITDTTIIDPVTLLSFKKVVVTQEALKQIEEQLQ